MGNTEHSGGGEVEATQARSDSGPQHKHDCGSCVFLGRYGVYDLYFHEGFRPVFTTLVARDGPAGEYTSGLAFSVSYKDLGGTMQPANEELAEARTRAIAQGFGPLIDKAEGRA